MSISALTTSYLGTISTSMLSELKQKFLKIYNLSSYQILDSESDLTDADKLLLWKQIAAKFGYDPLIQTTPPSGFNVLQAAYSLFLHDEVAVAYEKTLQTTATSSEIASRKVALQLFEVAINMLTTLENALGKENALLVTYAKWRQEYTKIITSMPLYGPEIPAHISVNTVDFGKTTLGYGNVSAYNAFDYLLKKVDDQAALGTIPVDQLIIESWGIDPRLDVNFRVVLNQQTKQYSLQIVTKNPATGTEYIVLGSSYQAYDSNVQGETKRANLLGALIQELTTQWNAQTMNGIERATDIRSKPSIPITGVSSDIPPIVTAQDGSRYYIGYFYYDAGTYRPTTFAYLKKVWETSPENLWSSLPGDRSQTPSTIAYDTAYTTQPMQGEPLPGPRTTTFAYFPGYYLWGPWQEAWPTATGTGGWGDELIKTRKADSAQFRAEKNALMQQWLETLRSRRQSITDAYNTTKGLIDQISQSISSQMDVLHSVVDSFKALITAIFS